MATISSTTPAISAETLAKERIAQIAGWLPEKPAGLGRPIGDRAFWDGYAAKPEWREAVARAEKLLATPIPAQPDDLYLEYSRNGNRTRWQNVASQRRGRFVALVLAECLENKGRFVPAIEEIVAALCAEKTWVMPAHDGGLNNFNQKQVDIDLASSALGWNMATAHYMLGEKLSTATRQLMQSSVQKFVLDPFKAMIRGQRGMNWWMTTTNNWNSVCLAGSVGAGLALLPSREERAEFVAAGENYSKHFLEGFTPDGYCSEGLGYWNYGFGHYVLLSELVRHATGDKLDLLLRREAKMPARFGSRIEIINGVSPAFADCNVFAKPMAPLMVLLNRKFALGNGYDAVQPNQTFGSLFEAMIYNAPQAENATGKAARPIRDFFENAGILVSRPAQHGGLGVAFKGGHNAEHHNHNDLGSFTVVSGERPILLDPGNETYTARTFSSKRYDSKLLNSYGHPVPVIDGKLQKEGAASRAKILQSDFSDVRDTLKMDIASAYPVPELKKLTRTFVYSRDGKGALSVTDEVALSQPKTFGTALLTLGSWKQQTDGSLLFFDVDEAVLVEIDAGGKPYSITAEEIREDAPVVPTRVGINLNEPVAEARITLKITPFTAPQGAGLLRNGNFEFGSWGWELPRNGMGEISTERFASGTASLKISDTDKNIGSNVNSSRVKVDAAKRYALRGKAFHVSGSGIGLYIKYFDDNKQQLNPADANGNIQPVGNTPTKVGQWESFSFPLTLPPGITNLHLWIHSFNGAQSEAFLDDLEIVEIP